MEGPVHILGIAPYESMKTGMARMAEDYPNIRLDVFTGDLQEGVEIVKRNLHNAYDCIISRGGTAEFIRQVTDIPVVEIRLSVYDVLRTIKLAENYSKRYAIVGFPSITGPAHTLCDLLREQIDILTVRSTDEIHTTLARIRDEGYRMVVSDMVTHTIARQMGMDAFLITSGAESLQDAFDRALTLGEGFRRLRQENLFLRRVSREGNGSVVVLDEYGGHHFSIPEEPKGDMLALLRSKLPEIPEGGVLRFYHSEQGELYNITGQPVNMGWTRYYLFHCFQAKIPLRSYKMGVRSYNSGECEHLLSSSFYAVSGAMGELEGAASTLAATRRSVMVLGETGTGKEQIARYLYLHSPLRNHPLVVVDCELANDKTWDFLLNHYNSPLNDRDVTVYFQHLEAIPDDRGAELLAMILDTDLLRRERLIFSCVCGPRGEAPEVGGRYALRLGCTKLELPRLRERRDEIPSLASLYLGSLNLEMGKQISGFEPRAMELLRQFDWPYNYTQFRQVLQSLVAMTGSAYISGWAVAELLSQERSAPCAQTRAGESSADGGTLEEIVRSAIRQTLAECGGNQSAAARRLNISRTTLWRHLNQGGEGKD